MAEQETQGAGSAEAAEGSASLLELAITATKQTGRDEAQDLIANLTKQAMSGTVTWDRNLTKPSTTPSTLSMPPSPSSFPPFCITKSCRSWKAPGAASTTW